ncbi:hypothetical protein CREGCYN_09970 [Synechococcus sp. M16CYN]
MTKLELKDKVWCEENTESQLGLSSLWITSYSIPHKSIENPGRKAIADTEHIGNVF